MTALSTTSITVGSPEIGAPSLVAMCKDAWRKTKRAFVQQRENARKRDIGWRFDLPTWIAEWIASGHYHQRGRRRGQYCMARPLDRGIYEPGNVVFILTTANTNEARKPFTEARKAKLRAKALVRMREGSPHLAELRARVRSPKYREIVSRNSKAYWARRRAEGASP